MVSSALADLDAAWLYLDLMKRVLSDSIFDDDPLGHVVQHRIKPKTPWLKRQVLTALAQFLARYRISMVEASDKLEPNERQAARMLGTYWPARAHTMIGMKRLDNLQFCVEYVIKSGVPGDLIETGVWRGGACIFMRAILKAYGDEERSVWVADSFAGLPSPNAEKYSADSGDRFHTAKTLAVSREEVEKNFRRYNLLDERVCFLQGWFKDTLPTAPIKQLAVLRLDGDMYESTIQALDALYDKLSPGGFVIIDDYALKPCAMAIHDFRQSRGITDRLEAIDGMSSFWQRSA